MSELDRIQAWMSGQLVKARALGRDAAVVTEARSIATGNERFAPVEQVEIYREQFWLRHSASLVEDFPGLGGVIGQSAWERVVESYLAAHPPSHWSLARLGHALPQHVATCTWLEQHALAHDMARLEWCWIEVFDAADAAPLDPARLAALSESAWATARLVTSPALRLLVAGHDVAPLRKRLVLAARGELHGPVDLPEPRPVRYALYRAIDRVLRFEELSPAEHALLDRLVGGAALVPACNELAATEPALAAEVAESLGTWLERWARLGWVVDVAN